LVDIYTIDMTEKNFVIVIPSYKNAKYYERNLSSVFSQNYDNFRVLYVDDKSPDNTGELVREYVEKHNIGDKASVKINEERVGALENLYNMIHSCQDDEIIVTLDGDDWFAHPNVLQKLNQVYSANDVWLTYGQYKSFPDNRLGCSQQIPPHVIQGSKYRRFKWCSSHLRTFYSWLFKRIDKSDLLDKNGKFYPMGWDLAFMFPMLEMSKDHHKFIKDVLYIYNYETPINDAKVNIKLQQSIEFEVRAKKIYQPVVK